MQIGFIGVGLMGQGMVTRLLKAGHQVRVMAHRNRAPIEAVKARGASEAADIAELARGAGAVILCVNDAETVARLVNGLKPHLGAGQIVIDTTTSDPRVSEEIAKDLARQKVGFADAPMTGGPEQVAAGEGGALVGADAATFASIEPLLGSTNSGALKKMVGPALKGDYDGYRFSMVNAEKDMRYYCTLAESLD